MNEIEVIAEIGINHNGDIDAAVALMKAAKEAACDTVKVQLWNTERVYPRERWDEMKRLELSRDDIVRLKDLAKAIGIRFLCTPDDIEDARFLREVGVERVKIGSSNITNKPLLREVGSYGLPIILSTGACEWGEMAGAVHALVPAEVTILHCVSAYPAPAEQMNMLVIRQIFKRFHGPRKFAVGFSDHTRNHLAAVLALGLGARTFEKHITLDRNQAGPDHAASSEPEELSAYVSLLRVTASMLGTGMKTLMPCEVKNRQEYERFVRQQYENHLAI